MIPVRVAIAKPNPSDQKHAHWVHAQANAFTDPKELLTYLNLESHTHLVTHALRASGLFKMRVTQAFANKMEKGNPNDPLLRQVLPLGDEFFNPDHFLSDPVGDAQAEKVKGLLHKYNGRVLLITTGICSINCRYCFRREYPYETHSANQSSWDDAFAYIAQDNSIKEVILSGGDPLTLSDKRLDKLFTRIEQISHVKRIRIHTRLPVVLPERITSSLTNRLANSRCDILFVVHSNHANEIGELERSVLLKLKERGITCLNQAVLLRGVNDTKEALISLSEALFEAGVLPYYLHTLDKVNGAAHFDVSSARAVELIRDISAELPGYLVPKLVREITGEPNKTPITQNSLGS